ncbi:MAG: transcriptional activator FtrA [Frankiales bacterium]|nr:transcriptional activator FtrA [Frankiales bacterium]
MQRMSLRSEPAAQPEPEGDGRGILHARTGLASFALARHRPSPTLAPFVDYLWTVDWDRRGAPPHVQRILPNPALHLSFEPGRSCVTGPARSAFTYELRGIGRVVGVRFRPGGARPWTTSAMSAYAGRELPVATLTRLATPDLDVTGLRAAVQDAPDASTAAVLVDDALARHRPDPDPMVDRVADLVAAVDAEPGIRRVEQLADRAGLGVRSLQRLCADWIGIGPKELVRWARLHEAAGRAASGPVDWAALAVELGYADQAHLVRDFSRVVGEPPARYARAQAD